MMNSGLKMMRFVSKISGTRGFPGRGVIDNARRTPTVTSEQAATTRLSLSG